MTERKVRVELVFKVYRSAELVERIKEVSLVGITSREEVRDLLAQIDCSVCREFSDYDLTPYHQGDDPLIVEATC